MRLVIQRVNHASVTIDGSMPVSYTHLFLPDAFSYETEFPMKCLHVKPLALKYAEALTHRDFLGAVLNLGIQRSKIGDLVVRENQAWIFASEGIASFLARCV